ncbi:MAG TPA: DUF1285 domain-containing protein [Rhodospirillaceae bacterium]|nr:DUF1285 domain-containing protein [Rhodospirillaceae bacterium]
MKSPPAVNDVEASVPGRGRINCGRIDMRIARDGKWFYHGTPIPRKDMVCLFASTLERRPDGSYWLITPAEEAEIEVDDVPFLAVELFVNGSGRDSVFSFRTNVDEMVTLDEQHPLRATHGGSDTPPYLLVRAAIEARLTRSVYYELVALGVEETVGEERLYGVWSSGIFFPLGRLDDLI